MKKNLLKRVCSALALTTMVASTASMTSFATIDASPYLDASRNGFTQEEIDASTIKPVVTVTNEILTLDYAKANSTREVVISVSGANMKYASSGLHIYYDTRLELAKTPLDTPDVKQGAGTEYLTVDIPTLDPTASEQGLSGVFVCSAAKMDAGLDGEMWKLKFTLPSDVKAGDVFPIDIFYKSKPSAEDLFTNAKDNAEGKLMQAYFFTKGINNGITSSYDAKNENFTVDGSNEKISGEEAIGMCAGLASVDASSDGVIAIADGAPETTTAATTTAATTTAATTTKATTTAATTTKATTTAATTTKATTTADTTTAATTTADTTTAGSTSTTGKTTTTTTSKTTTATTTTGTTAGSKDSPKTGVAGVGVAVAGLAVALGTAFVLRKKED